MGVSATDEDEVTRERKGRLVHGAARSLPGPLKQSGNTTKCAFGAAGGEW